MKILIVEDNRKTALHIAKAMEDEGMEVERLHDGIEGLEALRSSAYDVVILDIMLPGIDGLSIVRMVRTEGVATPVLLLSAHGKVNERVEGLNAGADDFLPKPFSLEELIARVQVLGRRSSDGRKSSMQVADLSIDPVSRVALRGGRRIDLTNREFLLLEFLMHSGGRICSRRMILEKVWEYTFDPGTNIIDVYIRKLREKIDQGHEVKLLHSIRGEGYVLKEQSP